MKPIRCPLCMAEIRELVQAYADRPDLLDRLVAKSSFPDWYSRAEHMTVKHGWTLNVRRRLAA